MEPTLEDDEAISVRDRAYYRRRYQHKIHSAIASLFAEEAAAGRMTKKKLATLIGKNPAQITRWLTEPSNYEADTVAEILLAMGAEMDIKPVRFSQRTKANYAHPIAAKLLGRVDVLSPKKLTSEHPYSTVAKPASNSAIVAYSNYEAA